ncbi:MAG: class II aldolase/adducin family protein [Pseudomonadota bacterium]
MPDAETTAAPAEGVIRFAYALEPPEGPVDRAQVLDTLRGWRLVLKRLGLVGQEPGRYHGFGFGNLSARDHERPGEFYVTASQTGGVADLEDADLVRILHANPARFWLDAVGHQPPSSEALTHAMIYGADPEIAWIFHVHSPDIWERVEELDLPATAPEVPYGSPDMVVAVQALLAAHAARPLVFVTRGHRDGVFACGAGAGATGAALVDMLSRAVALP